MIRKKLMALVISAIILTTAATQSIAAAFTDIPETHPYKAAIEFCEAKGLVNGIGNSLFAPDDNLTRVQFATIWCRFLGVNTGNHNFTDVTQLKNYYDTVAIIMNSFGILTGTAGSKFSPHSNITREQLALIIMRTFGIAAANKNDFQKYSDYASISTWAQEAVSACLNADVFAGLYDGANLQPQKPATRAEICKLIYNLSQPSYTVTIDTLSGGTITALPTVAHPGTTITLTITPDAGKQLKPGTLKFNDTDITGTTFTMPAEDVLVTAEFENVPVLLESIAVTTPPTKTDYTAGETLDLAGLVVTATYTDDSTMDVTGSVTTTPASGAALETEGANTITVSYAEGDITKTATFIVQVTAAPPSST